MNHQWYQSMLQLSELNQATSRQNSTHSPEQASLEDIALFLSHELRTPLTSIQGVLGLLDTGLLGSLSDEGHQLLSIAIKNVDRLTRLANLIEHETVSAASVLLPEELEQLQLENTLQQALERRDFQLVYQPIVALASTQSSPINSNLKDQFPAIPAFDQTGYQVIGFETLVRWKHPDKGYISPTIFIPLAERNDIIHTLGLWVLEQACQQLSIWQAQFPSDNPLYISVNLSARQLLKPDLPEQIQRILQKTQIKSASLKLEITETALFDNQQSAIDTLIELQKMGVQLYVDDFGTGYSSLSRLQDLPFDALKIDLSFVRNKRWDICETIIHLASNLGLGVIAEGVEVLEDLEALQSLGCRRMQGYLFSKPVNSDIASLLISAHTPENKLQ